MIIKSATKPTFKYTIGPWVWKQDPVLGNHYAAPHPSASAIDFRSNILCGTPGLNYGLGLFVVPTDIVLPSEYVEIARGDCREIIADERMRNIIRSMLGVYPEGNTLAQCIHDAIHSGDPRAEDRHKASLPDSSGIFSTILNSHGTIFSERFAWNGKRASRVRDVLRNSLVEAEKNRVIAYNKTISLITNLVQTKSGNVDQLKSLEHLASSLSTNASVRRSFGGMCDKYGLWNNDGWRQLLTPNEFDTTPLPHETSLAEDFNAASGFGNVYSWTMYSAGYFVNASNKAKRAGANATWGRNFARCDTPVSDDDHTCGIFIDTLQGNPANEQFGVVCRNKSSELGLNNYLYRAVEAAPAYHDMDIVKTISGTPTILSTITTLYDNIDIWLTCNGSSLIGQTGVAKTTRNSITDSALSGASYIYGGVYGYSSGSVATGDNWTLEDLVTSTTYTRTNSDNFGLGQSITTKSQKIVIVSNNLGLSDNTNILAGRKSSNIDNLGLSDGTSFSVISSVTHERTASDNLGLDGDVLAWYVQNPPIGNLDNLGLSDLVNFSLVSSGDVHNRTIADNLVLSDGPLNISGVVDITTSADNLALSDSTNFASVIPYQAQNNLGLSDNLLYSAQLIAIAQNIAQFYDSVVCGAGFAQLNQDALSLADILSTKSSLIAQNYDSLSLSDGISVGLIHARSVSDTLAVSDNLGSIGAVVDISFSGDIVGLSDGLNILAGKKSGAIDSIGLSDSISSASIVMADWADNVGLLENVSWAVTLSQIAQDNIALIDNLLCNSQLISTIQNTVIFSDNIGQSASFAQLNIDTILFSDFSSAQSSSIAENSDILSLSDYVGFAGIYGFVNFDNLGLSDYVDSALITSGAIYNLNIDNNLALSEYIVNVISAIYSQIDIASLNDNLLVNSDNIFAVQDIVGITDHHVVLSAKIADNEDVLGLAEGINSVLGASQTAQDIGGFVDNINVGVSRISSISDNLALSDLNKSGKTVSGQVIDNLGVLDGQFTTSAQILSAQNSFGLSDSVVVKSTKRISIADTCKLSDNLDFVLSQVPVKTWVLDARVRTWILDDRNYTLELLSRSRNFVLNERDFNWELETRSRNWILPSR